MWRFSFQEGREPPALAALRREYGTEIGLPMDPVSDITIVGADYTHARLSHHDVNWTRSALEYCRHHRIPISRSFKITPLNIAIKNGSKIEWPQINQNDNILRHAIPSHLLIIGFLYNTSADQINRDDCRDDFQLFGLRTSPEHFIPGSWPNGVAQTGASLVFAFAGGDLNPRYDISAKDLLSKGYTEGGKYDIPKYGSPIEMEVLIEKGLAAVLPEKGCRPASNSSQFSIRKNL